MSTLKADKSSHTIKSIHSVSSSFTIQKQKVEKNPECINLIKQDIAMDIARKLISEKLLEIKYLENVYNQEFIFRGEVKCFTGDPSDKFVAVAENRVVVNDIPFTYSEIIEAVKNTYPEKLL